MKNIFMFCALALLLFVSTTEARVCDDGWESLNGMCLKVETTSVTEQDAHDACSKLNARLLSVHSDDDQNAVLGLIKKVDPSNEYGFWIGLKLTRESDGKMISCSWTDGSAFDYGECKEQSGKAPWASRPGKGPEPNNFSGKQNCVFVGSEGWMDHPCDGKDGSNTDSPIGYICKQ